MNKNPDDVRERLLRNIADRGTTGSFNTTVPLSRIVPK
jgi:hypothetical protein